MRLIEKSKLVDAVKASCIDINYNINSTLLKYIKNAESSESSNLGKHVLEEIKENSEISSKGEFPLCQDTGTVVVFAEIGQEAYLPFDLYDAINTGVSLGYKEGYLRKSMVSHPLNRLNTNDNTPAIVHIKQVPGDKLKLKIASKGGGSENISFVKILTPGEGIDGIKNEVLTLINNSGGKACPPLTVGIGLGGNLEKAALLSKEALFRDLDDSSDDPILAKLETELLNEINKLGVGPMGLGGTTTALAVKINAFPCHIASLPLAINIQCHSARHTEVILWN